MHFQLAYLSPTVRSLLETVAAPEKVEALLWRVARAEIDSAVLQIGKATTTQDEKTTNTLNLLHNLVYQANFQPLTPFLQAIFEQNFSSFFAQPDAAHWLWQALHVIEPRLNAVNVAYNYVPSWENLSSRFEIDFISKDLPLAAGDFWIQLMEQQRTIENLPESLQAVDYAIEFPYLIQQAKGLCIEIDGEIHQTPQQQLIDRQRDNYILQQQWLPTWRIQTDDFNLIHRQVEPLKKLAQEDYFRRLAQNYRQPLTNSEVGGEALQVLLSPISIAHIQVVLVEALQQGLLALDANKWRLAIFEQDLPCASLAVENFQNICQQLFDFEGLNRKLPPIELTLIRTRRYETAKLHKLDKVAAQYFIADFQTEKNQNAAHVLPFDLLIDVAILQRKGWNLAGNYHIPARNKVEIRGTFRNRPQSKPTKPVLLAWFDSILQAKDRSNYSEFLYQYLQREYAIKNYGLKSVATESYLQVSNAALVAQNTSANPELNLLAVFSLAGLLPNASSIEKDKLLQVIHYQLFTAFRVMQYLDFDKFLVAYQNFQAQVLAVIPSSILQGEVENLFATVYQDLEGLPHLNWFDKFMQSFIMQTNKPYCYFFLVFLIILTKNKIAFQS